MNLKDIDVAAMSWSDVYAWIMERTPIEDRLRGLTLEQVLKSFTPEQRLSGLTLEQVLSALTPEQVLKSFTPEQIVAAIPPEVLAIVLEKAKH